ncbi:hypothetical protein F8388_002231 [Cannabis sativa]|uniref:Uncharacterized protein n=1 Tax=Cannabis sativa TaxID=3483 RepID=A0A7J6FNC5_CANSA|nr:hypothetical protein G4B88_009293 [Cannabis sativa]KAF4374333.1 hypothetical protein F8388_002231 [Cannabis sativa]
MDQSRRAIKRLSRSVPLKFEADGVASVGEDIGDGTTPELGTTKHGHWIRTLLNFILWKKLYRVHATLLQDNEDKVVDILENVA